MLLFFIASLCGVGVSFIHVSYAMCALCVVLVCVCMLYKTISNDSGVKKLAGLCALFFIGLVFGQLRVLTLSYPDTESLQTFESQKVVVRGVVVREPVSDGERQKIDVRVESVSSGSVTRDVHTHMRIQTHAFPEFSYGDVVVATGTLRVPEMIESDDGRVFDYQMFLFKDRITHSVTNGVVEKVGYAGNMFFGNLFAIKRAFMSSIHSVLGEPHAGLLGGILLGTDTLSKQIKEQFRVAGLSHIVVLSGYNITVVAESILVVTKSLSTRFAFGVSFLGIIFFVLMAGSGASAVRAGIMASIALLGKQFHKTYDASRALMLAVWGMVMWNPFVLLYDPSFHLSVLATVGVMLVTPIVATYISFITEKYSLRELSATTLGAQIAVLPYIIYMSGNFSVYAFPANFIVLPFVPLTMLLGFFTAVFGFVSRFVGLVPGIPTHLFLLWDLFIAETVSKLPFATIHIPYIPVFWLIVCYLVFGFFLYRFHAKQNPSDTSVVRPGDDSVVQY